MNSKNTFYKIIVSMLALMLCIGTVFTQQTAFASEDTDVRSSEEAEAVTEEATKPVTEETKEGTKKEALSQQKTTETTSEPERVAEKQADSWRYEDGYLSDEVLDYNAQMGTAAEEYPGVLKAPGDPGYGQSKEKAWVFKKYECSGGYLKGIDVSYWQYDIDWGKVKKEVDSGNLDFVIIRCGYGSDKKANDDSKFKRNADACIKHRIPFGVYLYSYATTKTAARSEAKHALRRLKGYYPDYPVYYDLEDSSILKATKSKSKITGFADIFCSTLANNGYKSGVYASLNWYNNYIDGKKLKSSGYDLWLAQWPMAEKNYSSYGYGSKYSIWQCGVAGDGTVKGIKGTIDTNLQVVSYEKMNAYMSDNTLPSTLTVKEPDISEGYINKTVTSIYGPGPGFRKSSSYARGTRVNITGMVNGYYQLDSGDWVGTSKIALPTEPKEISEGKILCYNGEAVVSDWAELNGNTYYADETGQISTGLVDIGSYKYAFDDDGSLLRSVTHWFGSEQYQMNSKGRVCLFKAKAKKKIYYRSGPGTNYKKKGTLKKNKAFYVARQSGSWSQMSNGYWIKTSSAKKTVIYPIYRPDTDVSYTAHLTSEYTSRSGPSTSYLKKTTYKKGASVKVTGTYEGWAKLSSGYWVPLEILEK